MVVCISVENEWDAEFMENSHGQVEVLSKQPETAGCRCFVMKPHKLGANSKET